MTRFYNPRRKRNKYQPGDNKPFKLSRSKIDLFIECPRCFYIDRRLGTGRPPGFPFNLNSAVDKLLKAEFDIHRAAETTHPLLEKYGIAAQPVAHEELDAWRENFKGVQYHHEPTNFIVTGAIDDLWIDTEGQYVVVDYKATSKSEPIVELDQDWHSGYKRQMEVYQWLLRQNAHPVSNTGYFVYCNGRADATAFDARLEFDITLIPHEGDDSWVEPTLSLIHQCLNDDQLPAAGPECDYCGYAEARGEVTGPRQQSLGF
ncbi:MAG: PD-(D/E)XK nuclease family protein [Gammaproteobacteria bacterium]|nr:PD-(D/E)XK nuclease family protein [Gammaproteobacteria bacterium]